MKTYTVMFRSDAESAYLDIQAKTPQQALARARKTYKDDPYGLSFQPYDQTQPVNEIVVSDEDGNELAVWFDENMRLRLAAPDLLESAELVVARWSEGDLAEAVRALDAAIAKAKGGAP